MKILPVRGSPGEPANGGVVSPGWRSRQISTCFTPMSSSVQPVTAIDPARTVESPEGVSTLPKGIDEEAAAGATLSGPEIVPGPFDAPANVTVTLPVRVPDAGSAASNLTPIVSAALPEPEAGATVSHG